MDDGGFLPSPTLARAPGIYLDISNTDYHGGPGISKSQMDRLARSPLHLIDHESESSDSMDLGTAVHAAVLEPDQFEKDYALPFELPPGALVTLDQIKARLVELGGKPARSRDETIDRLLAVDPQAPVIEVLQERHARGRAMLDSPTWNKVRRMRDALFAHEDAGPLLSAPGLAEASAYWIDPETGVLCRCRPDKVLTGTGILADLKTTRDASLKEFSRSAGKLRYWVQDPFYRDGWEAAGGEPIDTFLFITVESTRPHAVAVYELPRKDLIKGRREYRRLLRIYANCRAANHWPGYPSGIQALDIPPYLF